MIRTIEKDCKHLIKNGDYEREGPIRHDLMDLIWPMMQCPSNKCEGHGICKHSKPHEHSIECDHIYIGRDGRTHTSIFNCPDCVEYVIEEFISAEEMHI